MPDYAGFTQLTRQPRRQQQLRTEVVVPRVPGTFDTVLVAAVQVDRVAGLLPTGFSSATAGAAAADGTRMVDPISLRSGAPYNGVEAAMPGVWARGPNAAHGPERAVDLGPRAAHPSADRRSVSASADWGSFNAATRTFNPGQPAWASAYSSGAQLARVSLTGTQVRHVVYLAMQGAQTQVNWPAGAAGPRRRPSRAVGHQAGSGDG